jgi:single-stranded-DNA-specific exonuclease
VSGQAAIVSLMRNGGEMTPTAWAVNPYPWREAERLATSLGLPLVAAMVLTGRGFTDPVEARSFLECVSAIPDPFLFAHMEAAVRMIWAAVESEGRVVVHGDYDADGITATALMVLGLRELGARVEWYLPSRFNEGFGLSRGAVETIAAGGPGILLTLDCGVNYPGEVALAQEKGLEVVVVDHHQPGARIPECHVIHEAVGAYPHGDLCGVGLALKVLHALHVHGRGADASTLPEALHKFLDLVAVGTIADLAPLRGENRFYVKQGLKLLGIGQRLGLRALSAVSGCGGRVDSGVVAYRLAPRLNAAGRLADPTPPLRLLLTEDEEEARVLAAQLHELNGARQDVERQILEGAVAKVQSLDELPPVLVLAECGWHEGVVGIVASRLVERYCRPAILLGVRDGVAKGSGRSIAAYDLMAGLNACAQHLTIFGGHKQAAGLTLDAADVPRFQQAIEEHAAEYLRLADLVPVYHADAVLRGEDINADTALALAALGPFGVGNPKPRVLLVDAGIERAEATRDGAHLRCTVVVDEVRARGIGFGLGAAEATLKARGGSLTVGAQLQVDEWQGCLRPEFVVERMGANEEEYQSVTVACGAIENPRGEAPAAAAGLPGGPAEGSGRMRLPVGCRDRRNRGGRATTVAQLLASGESVTILTCSAAWTVADLGARLPLGALGGELDCLSRDADACIGFSSSGCASDRRTRFMEWEAAPRMRLPWPAHLAVVDPPFRPEQLAFLHRAVAEGSLVHLLYGDSERRVTGRFLRCVVHPRYAMVCLYRAMQAGPGEGSQLLAEAAEIAWEEERIVLGPGELDRAAGILQVLGVGRGHDGEAKLDARCVAAYVQAEADYEECSKLCLSL